MMQWTPYEVKRREPEQRVAQASRRAEQAAAAQPDAAARRRLGERIGRITALLGGVGMLVVSAGWVIG